MKSPTKDANAINLKGSQTTLHWTLLSKSVHSASRTHIPTSEIPKHKMGWLGNDNRDRSLRDKCTFCIEMAPVLSAQASPLKRLS